LRIFNLIELSGGSTMANFCFNCGTELPPTARFCSSCGTVVPNAPYIPGRPLVRPLASRKIAGVCAALAQAYGWDLALIRILAVVALLFSGGTITLVYLACWVGIPEERPPLL
jgi:phage shock protein PspC (stress-responsive transcriptional regulator)